MLCFPSAKHGDGGVELQKCYWGLDVSPPLSRVAGLVVFETSMGSGDLTGKVGRMNYMEVVKGAISPEAVEAGGDAVERKVVIVIRPGKEMLADFLSV